MTPRSFLFVPGDRPELMRKAVLSGADALILDLEDSVVPENKPAARTHTAHFLEQKYSHPPCFVRINSLGRGMISDDLNAILPGRPFGIVLPKADGPNSLRVLDAKLEGSDAVILPVVTETPQAVFQLGDYGGVTSRLFGLTWGVEDLSSAIGASRAREADGRYRPPYEIVRSLVLFGAHAANVPAFETIFPDISDMDGLTAYASRGRQDGFSGMLAIHPKQVEVLHVAFRPSDAELDEAYRIVALFQANPSSGVLNFEGRMVDAPHLAEAERILRSASERY